MSSWREQERLKDIRTYHLICSLVKDPPPPDKLFPLLSGIDAEPHGPDADDSVIFKHVAASLSVG